MLFGYVPYHVILVYLRFTCHLNKPCRRITKTRILRHKFSHGCKSMAQIDSYYLAMLIFIFCFLDHKIGGLPIEEALEVPIQSEKENFSKVILSAYASSLTLLPFILLPCQC